MLFMGAHCLGTLREIEEGIALSEEALALFRVYDDESGIIRALNHIGEMARFNGDYDRAGKAYEESLAHCRQFGDRQRESYALGNLGLVAQHQGNYQQAESYIKRMLILRRDFRAKYPLAFGLAFLSGPIATLGDPERAAQLLGASDAHLKAMGLNLQPQDQPEVDRFETAVRKQLSKGAFKSAWEKGQAMSLEQAIAFALEKK
jgi:tetratricopeptide (TPR) repeat protein